MKQKILIGLIFILFSGFVSAQEYVVKVRLSDEQRLRQMFDTLKIKKLYISPHDIQIGWGEDILEGDYIKNGQGLSVSGLESDQPYFDIKAILEEDDFGDKTCFQFLNLGVNVETSVVEIEVDTGLSKTIDCD